MTEEEGKPVWLLLFIAPKFDWGPNFLNLWDLVTAWMNDLTNLPSLFDLITFLFCEILFQIFLLINFFFFLYFIHFLLYVVFTLICF